VSKAKKEDPKSDEDWAYVGEWAVEEPEVFKGIDGDKGLVIKTTAAHHAISAKFAKPIDNKGKTLVVQYETKLQKGLECGGAYLKLLKDNKALHAEEFSNASPYVVMCMYLVSRSTEKIADVSTVGPDKCGSTNKVHFIVKHKNPKTGEYEEKHLKNPPMMKVEKVTNLYTLIVNPDQTYKIQINGETMKNGSMFDDFEPPFNPPKEIDDEKDTKPADWVDEARIPDPEAKKPGMSTTCSENEDLC
jgi:calnexin